MYEGLKKQPRIFVLKLLGSYRFVTAMALATIKKIIK